MENIPPLSGKRLKSLNEILNVDVAFFHPGLNASKCRIYLGGGFYDVMVMLVDDISFAPH